MLVCRHWYDIMLSIPGIHSQLRIGLLTRKRDVERFGWRWLLNVIIDTGGLRDEDFDSVEFSACLIATTEVASRWRSLALVSLPPPGTYKDLQVMHPLLYLESFKLAASCELGNFLNPLITAITKTVTPRLTVMEVFHLDAATHLVRPAHFKIFSSLTTLKLRCRRMQNPVDILPFLHKLEIFEAHHLSLTIYPPGVELPLTQTLRILHLKSVSIQWMEGRTFPALEACSIIFPQQSDAIQSVYMPSCLILKYDSNNLGALEHFHCPRLGELEVKCGQCRKWRGDLQLAALHPIFAAQRLTRLQLEIKCSERLLTYMLRLAPALEELWMGLSSPHALSSAIFLAFAAGGRNASAGPPRQTIEPLCRKLRKLHLYYKRWSRGTERNGLIPAFGAIVASHPLEEQKFSFRLSIGEGPVLQEWIIHEPLEEFDVEFPSVTFIGVPSSRGIVHLSRGSVGGGSSRLTRYLLLPRESAYITTHERLDLPIDYLFSFHSLKEVRAYNSKLTMKTNAQFPSNAPLFHMLKVLAVSSAPSSYLAGQTFHKLEIYEELFSDCRDNPGQGPLTEMPVCTRLDVPLSRLATLKLPQICELGVYIDHKNVNYIWGKHIVVNANLSELRLLNLRTRFQLSTIDITEILGSLSALETLVLNGNPFGTLLEVFIPTIGHGSFGLNQSSWEGQMPGVLCPRLGSLQIEGISFTGKLKLMTILKAIVSFRAIAGSPLKSFTFYHWRPSKKKWELIGKDGGFFMQDVVPAQSFQLDI